MSCVSYPIAPENKGLSSPSELTHTCVPIAVSFLDDVCTAALKFRVWLKISLLAVFGPSHSVQNIVISHHRHLPNAAWMLSALLKILAKLSPKSDMS